MDTAVFHDEVLESLVPDISQPSRNDAGLFSSFREGITIEI